jgi:4'-phosphopantetheinyl transferase
VSLIVRTGNTRTGAADSRESMHPNEAFRQLGVDDVHVWTACSTGFRSLAELEAVLSAGERIAAQRLRQPQDKASYILAHGLLRMLLAGYLSADPAAVHFEVTEFGKPYMPFRELSFSLSHAGEQVAIGVARSVVGVDIERVRKNLFDWDFARECLGEGEFLWLQQQLGEPAEAFFRLWTLKEAAMKADGRGLSIHCQQVCVRPDVSGNVAMISLGESEWLGYELPAPAGCYLSVAVGKPCEVRTFALETLGQLI